MLSARLSLSRLLFFSSCVFVYTSCKYSLILDKGKEFICTWNFDESSIWFELSIKSFGYVMFGFSKTPFPEDSDVIYTWIDPFGNIQFKDSYLSDQRISIEDKKQSYYFSGFENSTHTVFKFKRSIKTCDTFDVDLNDNLFYLLWGYHQQKPTSQNSLMFYGLKQGNTPAYLFHHPVDKDTKESYESVDLSLKTSLKEVVDSFYYVTSVVRLPEFRTKKHVIKWIPKIESEEVVKHMFLYACDETFDPRNVQLGKVYAHYQINTPQEIYKCNEVISVWTPGSLKEFEYPESVGYSFGDFSDPKFLMMEVLYDEDVLVKKYKGKKYDTLRSEMFAFKGVISINIQLYDAGVLSLGVEPVDWMIIPKAQRAFLHQGHCSSACTKRTFPRNGISVFANHFYTNNYVRHINAKHFRNGIEQKPMSRDLDVKKEVQRTRHFNQIKVIKPGDELLTECVFNTLNASYTNIQGLWSNQEKCLQFLFYYPKASSVRSCKSNAEKDAVFSLFQVQNKSDSIFASTMPPDRQVDTSRNTLAHFLYLTNWYRNGYLVNALQKIYSSEKVKHLCRDAKSTPIRNIEEIALPVKSLQPYLSYEKECGDIGEEAEYIMNKIKHEVVYPFENTLNNNKAHLKAKLNKPEKPREIDQIAQLFIPDFESSASSISKFISNICLFTSLSIFIFSSFN